VPLNLTGAMAGWSAARLRRRLLKDRRKPELDGESLAGDYEREANPLPRSSRRPARRPPELDSAQSDRAVAILSALVTAMTEADLLDVVIEHAADRVLELMRQGRVSACDTPLTSRLARTLVLEIFPIFRVEFHRSRDQRRLTADDCRDLIDAAVAQALVA
jgi:hypothetical protein